jgi:parallel beta-helix repeat protein
MSHRHVPRSRVLLGLMFFVIGLVAMAGDAAAASTIYVDQGDPNCANKGNGGTQAKPYCRIAAAAAQTEPGTTVLVSEGTYVEQVNPQSGAPGNPVTFEPVPGDTVTVTGKFNAFYLDVKSWVTIKGFTITETTGNAIHTKDSSNIQLIGNTVSEAGEPISGKSARGMRLILRDSLIAYNTVHHNSLYGIYLDSSVGNQVIGNVSYSNAQQFQRAASGIRLYNSAGNTVASNITHHNEDSGIELYQASNNNLLVNNVSYDNGDHGIDLLASTGQRVISNTAYRNVTAGLNAEGNSTGTTLANNISVDNGINSPRTKGNIRVDSTSSTGTTLDYDLLRIPSGQVQIDWRGTFYSSLSSFRLATGQEAHGIAADPKWVDSASGNFHLLSGSPAIDSANSGVAGQMDTDTEGSPRVDDFAVPNTGAGPRLYDDRGAYEFQPADDPPDADLTVTPDSGPIDLQVTADASASTDTDATPIDTYSFDFGDGSPTIGPQPGATATHTYTVPGTYTVMVTVRDTAGLSSIVTATATVRDDPPNASLLVEPASGSVPLVVGADASASTDTDATPIASYSFDFGDGSAMVGPQSEPTASHIYATSGTYTVTVTVTDTANQSSTATRSVSAFPVGDAPPDARLAVSPDSGPIDLQVTADASASTDNDATPIDTYRFTFGDGSPAVGPQPGPSADHTYTTPGTYTVTVTVTDTAGLSSTATATVTVRDDPPNASLVVQPASGVAPLVVSADASASTDTDATPIASYRFDFGDGSVVGPQPGATATHTYAVGGTYTVTVTVTDSAGHGGTATAQVIVKANLINNPGFETNTTGWNTSSSGSGVTLTRVAGGHTGGWMAQLTNTSTAASTCLLNDSPNWVTATSAGPYTAELWVRGETGGATFKLNLREYAGSTLKGTAMMQVALTTSWRRVTVTYTPASPGSSTLDYTAYVSAAAPGICFYADDASIYRP